MNTAFFNQSIKWLTFQRNIFASLSVILTICVLILSAFLFMKNERVIVLPASVEKEFWVEADKVSPSYLEQQGLFLSQLLFGKSTHSSKTQRETILRHCSPDFYGAMKSKLIQEEEFLKKQNASYSFFPISVSVNPRLLEVLIVGDKVSYVGGHKASTKRECYIIGFVYTGGRLMLDSVRMKEEKNA